LRDAHSYSAPSWLLDKPANNILRWRVVAFGVGEKLLTETVPRTVRRAVE